MHSKFYSGWECPASRVYDILGSRQLGPFCSRVSTGPSVPRYFQKHGLVIQVPLHFITNYLVWADQIFAEGIHGTLWWKSVKSNAGSSLHPFTLAGSIPISIPISWLPEQRQFHTKDPPLTMDMKSEINSPCDLRKHGDLYGCLHHHNLTFWYTSIIFRFPV